MPGDGNRDRDWLDIGLRAAMPLIVGLAVAYIGLFGDETLTEISHRQESARLITELQIKREQAESELRKDIFAQALDAFLLKGKASADPESGVPSLREMSKQLLRLELLALNFGDSLSLSPLFTEMRRDLQFMDPQPKDEKHPENNAEILQRRLNSLAKRVASTQLSSLLQRGREKGISIPLSRFKMQLRKGGMNCDALLFNKYAYAWPRDEVLQQFEDLPTRPPDDYIENLIREAKRIRFQGVERLLEVYVSDFNPCIGSLKVQIIVSSDDALQSREADKEFSLDYFNFPVVDNTRLQNNHRLAMVIEDIDLYDEVQPYIRLAAVIFPSEYASLRDRPGMEEARKLLASALRDEPEPASASITGRRVEDGLLIKTVTRAPCEASVFSRARCNRTN